MIFPEQWAGHIVAMTAGLVAGKVSHFVAAAKGADALSRRREQRIAAEGPKEVGPLRARLTRWSNAMIDVLDRPRLGPLVLFASAGIGFPPLAIVTVAAGVKRISIVTFTVITTIGCLARFLVTGWLVAAGIQLG